MCDSTMECTFLVELSQQVCTYSNFPFWGGGGDRNSTVSVQHIQTPWFPGRSDDRCLCMLTLKFIDKFMNTLFSGKVGGWLKTFWKENWNIFHWLYETWETCMTCWKLSWHNNRFHIIHSLNGTITKGLKALCDKWLFSGERERKREKTKYNTRARWKVKSFRFSVRKTRDKRPLGRDPDWNWSRRHTTTMIKIFWLQPMAPWASAAALGQGKSSRPSLQPTWSSGQAAVG